MKQRLLKGIDAIYEEYCGYADQLRDYVTDTSLLLDEAFKANKKIVFEGAQGTLLDIDHGTYPYVTSSNPTSGYAAVGNGIAPQYITKVMGIMKSYTTRVGEGPFPTELFDADGEHLRTVGHEIGTVTGRSRRCGWLDLVMVNYAIRLSGINSLALTKLDVLDDMDVIKVCTHYECNGERVDAFPCSLKKLAQCTPVYKEFKGWKQPTNQAKSIDELPMEAQEYIKFIAEFTGVDIQLVAVGPKRDETIIVGEII